MSAAAPFSSGTIVRARVAQLERNPSSASTTNGGAPQPGAAARNRESSHASSIRASAASGSEARSPQNAVNKEWNGQEALKGLDELSPYSLLGSQVAATNAWRRDLRDLFTKASERFADVCWTTDPSLAAKDGTGNASGRDTDEDEDEDDDDIKVGRTGRALTPTRSTKFGNTNIVLNGNYKGKGLVFAHKALVYARAPNTFQTKYLQLRTPTAQLGQAAAEESTVSLPLIGLGDGPPVPSIELSHASSVAEPPSGNGKASSSKASLVPKRATSPSPSTSGSATNKDASNSAALARKKKATVRGAFPPSSYPTKRMGSGGPSSIRSRSASSNGGGGSESESESISSRVSQVRSSALKVAGRRSISSRRSVSRDSSADVSGNETSDAEGSVRKKVVIRPPLDTDQISIGAPSLGRSSMMSDGSSMRTVGTADGRSPYLMSARGYKPRPSRPILLEGTGQGFLEAILEYLYTAEESMMDTFQFLYEEQMVESGGSKEEKLEKLQQDLTYMWRSKLFSDIRIVLDDSASSSGVASMRNIPDTMSVISLPVEMEDDPEDEVSSFSCHRFMLASRSPYFASQLLTPFSDSKAGTISLPSPPFTPAAVHFTLGFIYSGTLSFSNRSFDLATAFQLWRAGAYLGLDTMQGVVSALVASEFCHGFECTKGPPSIPSSKATGSPCKSCAKRVPRTLAFASCADVNDAHLLESARKAVSGPNFGTYWNKDVGNLDYASRGEIVARICDRLVAHPEDCIGTVRQLALVGAKVEVERGAPWIDALRWMIESVEVKVRECLESGLSEIVESEVWLDLLKSSGFASDVLEKLLILLIDALSEKKAASTYQILVGQVLLREEDAPTGHERELIEATRGGIIRYLKRRWVTIKSLDGFEGLENWALKEIADELDLKVDDLLAQKTSAPAALSRTGLKAATPATSAAGVRPARTSPLSPASSSGKGASAAPAGSAAARRAAVRDGEREPGPINLRAAAVNRSAARTASQSSASVTMPTVSSSSAAPARTSTRTVAQASRQVSATSQRTASTTSTSGPSRRTSNASIRSTASGVSVNPSTASRASSVASVRERAPSTLSVRSSAASMRRTAESSANSSLAPKTPTRRTATSMSPSPTPRPSAKLRPGSSESTDSSAAKPGKSPQPSLRSVRSSASVKSSATLQKPPTVIEPPILTKEGVKQDTIGRAALVLEDASGDRTQRARMPTSPRPGLSAATFTPPEIASLSPDMADTKLKVTTEAPPIARLGQTQLAHGIPCVIAPTQVGVRKPPRFRALVKYIGPIDGHPGSWLGVEISAPLPPALQDPNLGIESIRTDGALNGKRYFELGQPRKPTLSDSTELLSDSEVDEATRQKRQERQRRLQALLARSSTGVSTESDTDDGAKSPRTISWSGRRMQPSRRPSYQGSESGEGSTGLFIRPEDVLWVVMPE